MKRVILLLFSLHLVVYVTAQSQITGRVKAGDDGEALIGAHVYLLKNWRVGTVTDADGNFTLQISNEDLTDSLLISFVGFREQVLPISGQVLVKLDPVPASGEEVVIFAKPLIAEEFKYMKISKLDIYTNPTAAADPILAVNSLPSATTTDESANISLRGSSPIETGIFLNNVPIYDAVRYAQLNGIGTFSLFNTSIIKEVTVFPGNPPLEFGNTTAGVVSLTTDDRILDDNANSVIVSLANIGVSRDQRISDNSSLKLFSNWQPSGLIKALNHESLKEIKSFESGDLGLYWYGGKRKLTWKVFNYSLLEGYKFHFRHPSFVGTFDQQKIRTFLTASLNQEVGRGVLSLNSGVSRSDGDFSFSSSNFDVLNRDLFLGVNFFLPGEKLSWKSGISYDQRNSDVDGTFHEFPYALGLNHPTNEVANTVRSQTAEAFTYLKYYLSSAWTVGSGLRKNIPTVGQESYLAKQLNVTYASEPWSVTAGAGKYFKYGLEENNGELVNIESVQYSVDFNYHLENTRSSISFFKKEANINQESYDAVGAEVFVDYRFSPKLNGSLSLTSVNANSSSADTYRYDLSYFVRGNLSYNPGSFWTIESVLVTREGVPFTPVEGASFNSSLDVFEPIYRTDDDRLPAHMSIGLSISKIFSISDDWNVIGFASFNNVTDHKNIRTYIYDRDYTSRDAAFFSRRTGYIGAVFNF